MTLFPALAALSPSFNDLPQWGVLVLALAAGIIAGGLVLMLGYYMQAVAPVRDEAARPWGDLVELQAAAEAPIFEPLPESTSSDPFIDGAKLDRRQTLRRPGNPVPVLISDADCEREPIVGYVLNRSTGGLGVLLDHQLSPGTVLSIRPKTASESVPWLRVEVRNSRRAGRQWELGCCFTRTPPWSVLLMFG